MLPEFPKIEDKPDFQPPTDFASLLPWWGWALIAAGILLLGILLWWTVSRTLPKPVRPPKPPPAPQTLAMQMLEDLRSRKNQLSQRDLAQSVIQIIRTWLHRSFGIMANYRTTQEILALRADASLPPPPPALRGFQDFLLGTDALNFGGNTILAPDEAEQMIDQAINVIRRATAAVVH
jgi:hypothetical protein